MKSYFKLHFIVLIWGFTAILGKEVSIPAVELVFYRTLLAMALLAIVLVWRKQPLQIGWAAMFQVLGIGCLIAAHWILFFAAARVANVSACLIGMATSSLWTGFLEPLANRRKISKLEIGFGLLALAGLSLIFIRETKPEYLLGMTMAVFSALLGAFFSVLNGKITHRFDPFVITIYEMGGAWLFTTAFLPVYALYFAQNQQLQLIPNINDWFYIVLLAGVCTVYAFSESVLLMRKFSVFTMNLTINLEPVYGIFLAFLIYREKEQMTTDFYLGAAVILLSVFAFPVVRKAIDERRGGQIEEKSI